MTDQNQPSANATNLDRIDDWAKRIDKLISAFTEPNPQLVEGIDEGCKRLAGAANLLLARNNDKQQLQRVYDRLVVASRIELLERRVTLEQLYALASESVAFFIDKETLIDLELHGIRVND